MEKLRARGAVFEWTVGLGGIAIGFVYLPHLRHYSIWLTLFFFALAIFLEFMPIPLGKSYGSLLIALPIGVMVVYGPAEAVWLMIVAELVAGLFSKYRRTVATAIFNAGQYVIAVAVMSLAYRLLTGPSMAFSFNYLSVFSVLVSALTFLVCNHLLVHLLNWFRDSFDSREVWRVFVGDGINALVALPFAFLMMAFQPNHSILSMLVILPIVLAGQMMRMYSRMTYLHTVHDATSRLTSEFDVERINEEAAKVTAALTHSDTVVIFTASGDRSKLLAGAIHPLESVSDLGRWELPKSEGGIIWSVIEQEKWEYVQDTFKEPRAKFRPDAKRVYRSMAIFPMRSRGEVLGAIVCYSLRAHAFSVMTEYIGVLANQVAVLLENAELYHRLEELSLRDGVTGLYNHRYFYDALSTRLGPPGEIQPFSVALLDADAFKKFNDNYGHLAGDAVLRSLGTLLSETIGSDGVVARYGGEEFSALLPIVGEEALAMGERIRLAVAGMAVVHEGQRLPGITVSIGIACYPEHATDGTSLLLKADQALYWGAKQRGRNRTAMYSPEYQSERFVDALTGLHTPHFVEIQMREQFEAGTADWGVLCMDLAGFGEINRRFGFDRGNRILGDVGQLLRESLRQSELVCRYGGDEFLVLLPNVTDEEIASVAMRICRTVEKHRFSHEKEEAESPPVRFRWTAASFEGLDGPDTLFAQLDALFVGLGHHEESITP